MKTSTKNQTSWHQTSDFKSEPGRAEHTQDKAVALFEESPKNERAELDLFVVLTSTSTPQNTKRLSRADCEIFCTAVFPM